MNIGFDFDKVFVNYPPGIPNKLIDYLYKGHLALMKGKTKNVTLSYRYPGTIEQKIRMLSHAKILRPAIIENINALKKISQLKNCKTYLVSSRYGFLKSKTEEWLEKEKIEKYFSGIYFNFKNQQPHVFKMNTIKKLKIDAYVDDDIDLLVYLSKNDSSLKLFWITDTNTHEYTTLPSTIHKIKNISELYTNLLKHDASK